MTGKALRVVFMGTPQFAVPTLERIAKGPHEIVGVVTQPDRPSGRGHEVRESPVKRMAAGLGVPILQPRSARTGELASGLRELAPDVAVVVAYGRILPPDVIAIPRLGCINAHASLLPQLRGAAPIQRAIIAGDTTSGVTIMQIDEEMDAGDVLLSRAVEVERDDDAATLGGKLSLAAADLLTEALDGLAAGTLVATPQDHSLATYAPPILRDEAAIDWGLPAVRIECRVRAFRPEPGAFTLHDGLRLKVLRSSARQGSSGIEPGSFVVADDGTVSVACGDGALVLEEVRPEGGRAMSAGDYLRGRGAGRGRRFGTPPPKAS